MSSLGCVKKLYFLFFSFFIQSFAFSYDLIERQGVEEKSFCTVYPNHEDRALGVMLGSACGDAVGTTLEFEPRPNNRRQVAGMVGGGPFGVSPGEWTDDTSLMLNLAETLYEKSDFEQNAFMDKNVAWWKNGYNCCPGMLSMKDEFKKDRQGKAFQSLFVGGTVDIGNATTESFYEYELSPNDYQGSLCPTNGCLMRNAPVPVRFCNDLKKAMAVSDAHVRCTHSSDYVIEINRLFTQMAVVGINCCGSREDTIKSMLDAVKYFVTTQEDLKRLQQHVEWLRSLSLARLDSLRLEVDIKMQLHCFEHPGLILHSSGHAGDSFFCAIWALLSGRDFEETILNAVNLGNDADTVGAITGQLAGAVYGASAIPGDWKKNLYCEKVITAFAKALYGDSISGPISINVGSKDCNRLALSLKQKNQ